MYLIINENMRRIIILNLNNSFTDLQFLFWYTQTNFFYVAMCRDKELEKLHKDKYKKFERQTAQVTKSTRKIGVKGWL
jgi:hypothetical protein